MKEKARAKLQDPDTPAKRFKATDSLLEFLKTRDCENGSSASNACVGEDRRARDYRTS
jgi:hypothetical protein